MAATTPLKTGFRGVINALFKKEDMWKKDPVTGSAHCSLVPYWAAKLKRHKLKAEQISRRLGTLYCEDFPDEYRVSVEGRAVTYMKGVINVPTAVEAEGSGKR